MANNFSTTAIHLYEGNTESNLSQSTTTLSTVTNDHGTVYEDAVMEDMYEDDLGKEYNDTVPLANESDDMYVFDWNVFLLGAYNAYVK